MSESEDQAIGRRIRQLREARGLSQFKLANAVNLLGEDFTQQTVFRLEKGERSLKYTEGKHIAQVLGCDFDAFTSEVDPSVEALAAVRNAQHAFIAEIKNAVKGLYQAVEVEHPELARAQEAYWLAAGFEEGSWQHEERLREFAEFERDGWQILHDGLTATIPQIASRLEELDDAFGPPVFDDNGHGSYDLADYPDQETETE